MAKKVASIEEVKDFCNRVREAGGGKIIDDLLPSFPGETESCLIAKGLNFKCCVYDYQGNKYSEGSDVWAMHVDSLELALKIGKALKLKVDEEEDSDGTFQVLLPKKIARVAMGFDAVADLFINKYKGETVHTAETVERIVKSNLKFYSKLIEENLTPAQKKVIQTYWKYIHRDVRKGWIKPSFV